MLWAVPVVFAITLHEAAHGYVAKLFGDQHGLDAGPRHAEPAEAHRPDRDDPGPGRAACVGMDRQAPPFVFGWAKPVPVNFGNLRNPKRDMIWVAGGGPGSNFVHGASVGLAAGDDAPPGGAGRATALFQMADIGIQGQSDADGAEPACRFRRSTAAACSRWACCRARAPNALSRIEPYGLFIVLALLATGVLDDLMRPLMRVARLR